MIPTMLAEHLPIVPQGGHVDHVWHFWLAAALAPATVLLILTIAGLYFFKVTRLRYPKR